MADLPRVAMVGTFDVQNLGDLLFPLVAREALERRLGPIDLVCFSYRAMGGAGWPYPVRELASLGAELGGFDILLVGGGELIRGDDEIAPGYLPTDPGTSHPFGTWIGPTLAGAVLGVPVVWNALGVGRLPEGSPTDLIAAAAACVGLVAVRDLHSAKALGQVAPGAVIRVVPDTAFGLTLPPPAGIASVQRRLLGSDEPYVVVQPSAGMAAHGAAVVQLAAEAVDLGLRVLELPIGPVLGDRAGRIQLPGAIALDAWPTPLDSVALLAGAEAVIADSLHAATIALVAGVPVFRPPTIDGSKYELLDGFATVHSLEVGLDGRAGRQPAEGAVVEARARLEAHWDAVTALIGEGTAPPTALVRFFEQLPASLADRAATARELSVELRIAEEFEAGYAAYRDRAAGLERELEEANDRLGVLEAQLDLVEQRVWWRLGERLRPALVVAGAMRRRWLRLRSRRPPG